MVVIITPTNCALYFIHLNEYMETPALLAMMYKIVASIYLVIFIGMIYHNNLEFIGFYIDDVYKPFIELYSELPPKGSAGHIWWSHKLHEGPGRHLALVQTSQNCKQLHRLSDGNRDVLSDHFFIDICLLHCSMDLPLQWTTFPGFTELCLGTRPYALPGQLYTMFNEYVQISSCEVGQWIVYMIFKKSVILYTLI